MWRPVYVQCTYAPSSQSALFLVMLGTQRICHRPCSPKTDQHSFWWKIFLALSCIEPVLSGPIEFSEKFFKSNWCHETFGLLLQVNNLQKVSSFPCNQIKLSKLYISLPYVVSSWTGWIVADGRTIFLTICKVTVQLVIFYSDLNNKFIHSTYSVLLCRIIF